MISQHALRPLNRSLLAALALALAAGSDAAAQGLVTSFQPGATGYGDLVALDEATGLDVPLPGEFANLRFLPLDHSGRVTLFEGTLTKPRRRDDIPGANRLELQQLHGDLLRYERIDAPSGARRFGFMNIDAAGMPRIVLERAGAGPLGDLDPFLANVGVSPEGTAILVATRQIADGDVFEIDLATGAAQNRTAGLHPQLVTPGGLALSDDWGVVVTRRGVLRFARSSGAQVEHLAYLNSPRPTWYLGDVVLSNNGQWAAIAAGASGDLAFPFVFGATGPALRVHDVPARLSAAGFAPAYDNGPYLAVSDDGALCAWRVEGLTRELFLGRVPAPGGPPSTAEHVTNDAQFIDTLDEVGQALFVRPDKLVFALGERHFVAGVPEFEGVDYFSAEAPATSGMPLALTNLSMSSGDVTAPFLSGVPSMHPIATLWDPVAERLVLFDDGDGEAVIAVDANGGVTTILDGVKDVDLLSATNAGFLLAVRRTNAAGGNRELHRAPLDLSAPATMIASSSSTAGFDRLIVRRDGWVSFVETLVGGGQRLWRLRVANGAGSTFDAPSALGPALAHTAGGALAFTLQSSPGTETTMLWSRTQAVPAAVDIAPGGSFVLPRD